MKINRSLISLGLMLVFGSVSAWATPKLGLELKVTFKSTAKAESAASHLSVGYGKIVRKINSSTYVLRLNSVDNLKSTLEKLNARKSVQEIDVLAPELPKAGINELPVSKLDSAVQQYKKLYTAYLTVQPEDEMDSGEGEVDEIPGLDFLEGYLQHKRDRAYPNEEIDFTGYRELINKRMEANNLTQPIGRRGGVSTLLNTLQKKPGSRTNSQFGDMIGASANNWEPMGPTDVDSPYRIYFGLDPVNGRCTAVAVDPTDQNTAYIGGAQGGVWKTTDGGVNWTPLTDTWPSMGVSSIAIHPTNPNIVLAGTGDFHGFDVGGFGIMRSTDGGSTWSNAGANISGAAFSEIVFDPGNPNIVMATSGRLGSGRIWRSTDAGATWSQASSQSDDWSDISIGAPNGSGVRNYYAVAGGGTARIWRSTDQGVNWSSISNPTSGSQNPISIAASKIDPNVAYLLSTTDRRIYKTTNGGSSWSNVTAGFPNGSSNYNWSQGWYDYHINTSVFTTGFSQFDAVYVGLIDIVFSLDGASSWRSMGGANYNETYSNQAITHNDQHSFAVDPQDANRVWVGNDGGIYRAVYNPTNDTIAWDRLSKNLAITQFYTLAVHPTDPDYVKGGTQDNATPHSFGNIGNWGNPGAGDGCGVAINYNNTNIQYNSSQYQNIYRTLNEYSSDSTITPSWSGHSRPFIGKLWLDPNNPRYLYANTNYLNRWDETTDSWSLQLGGSALAGSGTINAFAAAVGDSNRLYTGSGDGRVYISTNFGSSFTRIDRQGQSNGLPDRSVSSISVNPNDKNDIIVGMYGTGAGTLWRCTNPTAGTPTWTRIDGNGGGNPLPNIPLNTVERDPADPINHIWVGTDLGVFETTDGGANWTDITQSRGLPNTQVNWLIFNPTTEYLTAATFGRGMWRLSTATSNVEVQSVSTSPNSVISGDSSTGTVTLDAVAPTGGQVVNLLSDHGAVHVPATVTVSAGSSSANFPITTDEVTSNANATIFASVNTTSSTTFTALGTQNATPIKIGNGNAVILNGGLAELSASDDSRFVWEIFNDGKKETDGQFLVLSPFMNPTWARVELEMFGSHGVVNYTIQVLNHNTGTYQTFATGSMPTTETTVSFDITSITPYLQGGEEFTIGIVLENPTGANINFSTSIDRVRVRFR